MTVESIAGVLGGPAILKRSIASSDDLMQLTRDGVPSGSLAELASAFSIDSEAVAHVCGLPVGSPRLKESLDFAASDRAIRLARIFAGALDVFQDSTKAAHWLQTPLPVLDGRTPFDLLDTDAGSQTVQNILTRISYGVYS